MSSSSIKDQDEPVLNVPTSNTEALYFEDLCLKLKDLEAEVLRYQRLVGQQALQITVLKDVIEKKL